MAEPYVHRLRVRYGECDPQGIVFNARYLEYFDVALTELWRDELGGYAAMMAEGIDMVVAEARARYLRSAGFDDVLAIEMTIAHLGTTSLTTRLRVKRDDELVVEGEMRHVFVDVATREKTPIPERIRRGLEPLVELGPDADLRPREADRVEDAALERP